MRAGRTLVSRFLMISRPFSLYRVQRTMERSSTSGKLTTAIAEDVLSLLDLQFHTLQDYFRDHNELLQTSVVDTIVADFTRSVFAHISNNQRNLRPIFLYQGIDECCAAANDFLRMSDKLDALSDELLETRKDLFSKDENSVGRTTLKSEGANLVASLMQDAVQAAEHIQVLLMRKVNRTTIASDLFSPSWEDEWTHNEVMIELLQLFDVDLARIQTFMSADHLYHKTLTACCKAIVCFYIRCLVQKADSVSLRRRNRERVGRAGEQQPFRTPDRALRRMSDDIAMIKGFFKDKSTETMALMRILGEEMRILELIHECLASDDSDSLDTFIVVIHKRTGADALVTRHFVSDLWLLVQREEYGGQLHETISTLEADLQMVSAGVQERRANAPPDHSYVQVDQMLRALYEDRIAQGLMPVCWGCLPKSGEEGTQVVGHRIRDFSRKLVELPQRLKKNRPQSPEVQLS